MTTTERIVEAVRAEIIKEYGDTNTPIENVNGYFITGLVKSAIASVIGKDDWISVDEKYPEVNQNVMVYCATGEVRFCHLDYIVGELHWIMTYNKTRAFYDITHWRNMIVLPAPPKDLTPKTDTTDGE